MAWVHKLIEADGHFHIKEARFLLYSIAALDIDVDLNSGATKTELLEVISGHILAEGEIARKYRTSTGCMYCAVTPSEDSTGQNKEAGLGKRTVNKDKDGQLKEEQ